MIHSKNLYRRELKRQIITLTNGILETATDLVLFSLFMSLTSIGKTPTSRGVHRSADEADEILSAINYKTIKNSLYRLKKKGFISYGRQILSKTAITDAGLARISNQIPTYDTQRIWDKMIYLINYDIPRDCNWYSKQLREILLKFKALQIQHSLYLTPYNPKGVLEKFVNDKGRYGKILVSTLAENSSVGEEDIKTFLWESYGLEDINDEYKDFIARYKGKKNKDISCVKLAIDFLSIVRHDPQLPYELLHTYYLGDAAYLLLQRLTNKQSSSIK